MIKHGKFEAQHEEIYRRNTILLEMYRDELKEAGMSPRTIKGHVKNVDLYINDYLLQEEPLTMEQGLLKIDDYLGRYYVGKYW